MDALSKKLFKELEEMQQQTGRMLRNMALTRMLPAESGTWQPPADVYEAETEIYVYFDLAGVDRDSLDVMVDDHQVRVRGRRQLPSGHSIACIHQLEIEIGSFGRTVALPAVIDVERAVSEYADGILMITLPKKKKRGKIRISISAGE